MKTKFLINLALVVLMLTGSRIVMAGQCKIEAGPGWMKGSADAAPLGKVLALVAEKADIDIYVDEAMEQVPVSFNIKENLTTEKSIKKILHSQNHSIVFGSEPGKNRITVKEIWIFCEGRQKNARYVAFSAARSGGDIPAGYTAGRALEGEKMLRQDVQVKRSIFGTPVVTFGKTGNGDYYRPNAREMKKAYEKFLQEKSNTEHRQEQASFIQARLNSNRQAKNYHEQRNNEIKKYILEAKQNKK